MVVMLRMVLAEITNEDGHHREEDWQGLGHQFRFAGYDTISVTPTPTSCLCSGRHRFSTQGTFRTAHT